MKNFKRKLVLCLGLLAILLIPVQSVLAVSFSSQVSGVAPLRSGSNWVIKIWYLKTTITPSTGHIEGEVRFTIQVPLSRYVYVFVKGFYIFGDGPNCEHNSNNEYYSSQYRVEWDESPETHTQYIDTYVDEEDASAYSTTLRLFVFSGAFPVSSVYIYEQVFWVKEGSVYWALSSGFCVSNNIPPDLFLWA